MSYIGTTEIGKMFLGSVEIDKAYLGNDLVFSSEPEKPKYTFTANPSSSGGTSTVSNASRAYTDENSTTYANPRLGGNNVANSWYFKFNTSSIPQSATIISVSCKARAKLTATSTVSPRTIGLYSGSTLKGSTQNLTTSDKIFTFSGETWTLEELSDARVTVNATKSSGSSPWLYFYGATLTVEYYDE